MSDGKGENKEDLAAGEDAADKIANEIVAKFEKDMVKVAENLERAQIAFDDLQGQLVAMNAKFLVRTKICLLSATVMRLLRILAVVKCCYCRLFVLKQVFWH